MKHFADRVFHVGLIEERLPQKVARNWIECIEGRGRIDPKNLDAIAEALKEWALEHGATHYTHWFQPLTNASAEKHDSFFLSWSPSTKAVQHLKGQELLRGEPDASSFPSGGLRFTHAARGYTVWDPTSLPFLWEKGTLCIPSLFFSWKGQALDHKIPLLRSEEKLDGVVKRLLNLCGVSAQSVFSTLGLEQEYFAIDRDLFEKRPDLFLAGRTVYGAKPAKGQELEDHYFGAIKGRIMAYMQDFERAAIELGIPIKTRHNEVAPAQYEVAPLFERATRAVDHNLLLMELMRQTAQKHHLACLMHEKPFQGINGSGKHNNWSLATDSGLNLLDPQKNSLVFVTLLTAILRGIHEHAALLRASIASAGNDHRLGGSEAPPTILSVYLGDALEELIREIIHDKKKEVTLRAIDIGISYIPKIDVDASDRNRTSFFAFTGNKFEFRAVGAPAHCGLPICVINAVVADSLQLILDEINDVVRDRKLKEEALFQAALPVLRKHLKAAQPVIFSGNSYSAEWEKEAAKRGLPNIGKSFHALHQFLEKKNMRVFEGILTEEEIHSRYEIWVEQYAKIMNIEINLMVELFKTQILPAAIQDQNRRGKAPSKAQTESLKELTGAIDKAIKAIKGLEKVQRQAEDLGWEAKGKVFCELAFTKMEEARVSVDHLETLVDDELWPLPKYREILFNV